MPQRSGRTRLTEVNPYLSCVLCHGYFIDATTMAECTHSFCRSCIVLYLETKSYCPICEVQIHKTKPHLNLKPDKTLQDIVYKLVPDLYHKEMERRRQFYANHPDRDMYLCAEARGVGVDRIIYSPEDNISICLEYLDDEREKEEWATARPTTSAEVLGQQQKPTSENDRDGLRRYLQCQANLSMAVLKKFIRMKYGASQDCTVEVLYRRESLPDTYTLMDIAYIYTWKRNEPMCIYYRINVPTPLPPLTPTSVPILEPTKAKLKSPELLDAVGLRPKSPELRIVPKLDLDRAEIKNDCKLASSLGNEDAKSENNEEASLSKKITSLEDSAVSLLLSLRDCVVPPRAQVVQTPPLRPLREDVKTENPDTIGGTDKEGQPPPVDDDVFKVPQSLTKRFVFNGGKLTAAKPKSPGKSSKTKVNGSMEEFSDPFGLVGNGSGGLKSGKLFPGSPRPPPNSEKVYKTKYLTSGLAMNWPNSEVTVTKNSIADTEPAPKSPENPPVTSQLKPNSPTQQKSNGVCKTPVNLVNGHPVPHRKEHDRLERIVQNCLKKEAAQKALMEETAKKMEEDVRKEGNVADMDEAARAVASITSDLVSGSDDTVGSKEAEQPVNLPSLKRGLSECTVNRRPEPQQNGIFADSKKRQLVIPDLSIHRTVAPVKEKPQKERKRESSNLSALTKRFLQNIKERGTEMKSNKLDQTNVSTADIDKVPTPTSLSTSVPQSSPGTSEKTKPIDGSDYKSEEDLLFIEVRSKCDMIGLKRKRSDTLDLSEVLPAKSNSIHLSPTKSNDSRPPTEADTSPKPCATHKKLPRLIEINTPPRSKLPPVVAPPDPKHKTGLKMTTVRKEVPIVKEVPQVRRDVSGALDLSSGVSPTAAPKSRSKSPYHRPSLSEKSVTPSSLSPILSPADPNRASHIRIPSVRPRNSPTPRPSSLSATSPSSPRDVYPSALQLMYRQHLELQSRYLASQVNNNWSRDPTAAKKLEELMRMNLPHHHPMFPEAATARK